MIFAVEPPGTGSTPPTDLQPHVDIGDVVPPGSAGPPSSDFPYTLSRRFRAAPFEFGSCTCETDSRRSRNVFTLPSSRRRPPLLGAASAPPGCSTGEDLAQAFPIRIARRPQSDRAD